MSSLRSDFNIFIRSDDMPLRTKIVATIGTPDNYKKIGIVDLKGRKVGENKITWEYLVEKFYENGVDIIRLNCSHLDENTVREVFLEIKRSILQCEKKNKYRKRMAVLADLPGPKIRFDIKEPVNVSVGSEFTIVFDRIVSDGFTQTVYIDGIPLKEAMDREDKKWHERPPCPPDVEASQAENVLGYLGGGGRRYSCFMNKIDEKLQKGERLLVFVGDGEVVMEVLPGKFNINAGELTCKIFSPREADIEGSKGFTLKGIDIDMPTFTATDKKLLANLLKADLGNKNNPNDEPVMAFAALSFVQTADDLLRARNFIEEELQNTLRDAARLGSPDIIAKIETGKGWRNRDFILDIADGVMVARGDLGLQMEIEEVPRMQKLLIELCNKRGKPVITATEMLKSMTTSIEPTRAEVSDVFNAIEDGTDAVMTSEETAFGRYPFHTLRKMVRIAEKAELHIEMYVENEKEDKEIIELKKSLRRQRLVDFLKDDWSRIEENERRLEKALTTLTKQINQMAPHANPLIKGLEWRINLYREKLGKTSRQETTNRITQAACMLTEATGTRAIFAVSASGRTARMISRLRPAIPIIGAAHDLMNMRKMLISFGVLPIYIGKVEKTDTTDIMFEKFCGAVLAHAYLGTFFTRGDTVIFTAGTPLLTPGTTNLAQIKNIQ